MRMVTSACHNTTEVYGTYRDLLKDSQKPREDLVPIPLIKFKNGLRCLDQGTITQIQGAKGANKSRLASAIIATALGYTNDLLQLNTVKSIKVLLFDTERNRRTELALAIKDILTATNQSQDFLFFSLSTISRSSRQQVMEEIIKNEMQKDPSKHFIIVADVVTDLVSSFNNEEEALNLFGYFSRLSNDLAVSIVQVIHENPMAKGLPGKARGHVGTEGQNKSSNVLSVGYQGNMKEQVLKIRSLKSRNAAPGNSIYAEHDPASHLLRRLDSKRAAASHVNSLINQEELDLIKNAFLNPSTKTLDLNKRVGYSDLATELRDNCEGVGTVKTGRNHLKRIIDSQYEFCDSLGVKYKLEKTGQNTQKAELFLSG